MENNIKIIKTKHPDNILIIENSLEHPILSYESIQKDILNDIYSYYIIKYYEEIVGYINFSNCVDHTDLISIAILPKYRGQGMAKKLMLYMETIATFPILLEVRETNLAAIKLYEALNYQVINVRKDYYSNPIENALIYIKESPTK